MSDSLMDFGKAFRQAMSIEEYSRIFVVQQLEFLPFLFVDRLSFENPNSIVLNPCRNSVETFYEIQLRPLNCNKLSRKVRPSRRVCISARMEIQGLSVLVGGK